MCPVLHTRFTRKIVPLCIINIFMSNTTSILDKTTTAKLTSMITEKIEDLISSVISKTEPVCFKAWCKVISILQLLLSVFYILLQILSIGLAQKKMWALVSFPCFAHKSREGFT